MELAEEKYEELESWYDEHPEASFEELETQAREKRRELMGEGLRILVNGRDSGYQLAGQVCAQCGAQMEYKGEGFRRTVHGLEGDTALERAYYVCPECEGGDDFSPWMRSCSCGRIAGVAVRRAS
jgi:DNA-directed RNA polymerase subunit RPC12/RpoP